MLLLEWSFEVGGLVREGPEVQTTGWRPAATNTDSESGTHLAVHRAAAVVITYFVSDVHSVSSLVCGRTKLLFFPTKYITTAY